LDTFCRAVRNILNCRHALLTVLDEDGQTRYFFESERDEPTNVCPVGSFPTPEILRKVVTERSPFRWRRTLGVDPGATLPFHLSFESLLMVPLASPGRVYGWFCIVDKQSAPMFGDEDEELAVALGTQAAVAYENILLSEQLQCRAVELKASEERLRFTLSATGIRGWAWDIAADRVTCLIPSEQREYELGTIADFYGIVHPDDRKRVRKAFERAVGTGTDYECEFRVIEDGRELWLLGKAAVLRDHAGKPISMAGINIDITERRRIEEEVKHLASHDILTGLPNRLLFTDRINIELAQAHRNQRMFAVMFLDIDRFKNINDSLGHTAGDLLLQETAARLKACIRESDTVCRIGGDEYTILLSDIAHEGDAASVAEKISAVFQKPFTLEHHEFYVTPSIGISLYPSDGTHAEALIKNADIAMYYAKEQGRNNFQFYNSEMNVRTIERMILENRLRQTLERGELVVYYQPLINAHTRKIVGAETLVRWKHPDLGLLDPAEFIPLAEEIGFIVSLDEWVLRTACEQAAAWQRAGAPPLSFMVNISARQFGQPGFTKMLSRILYDTGLGPEWLELEITENAAMQDIADTMSNLKELSRLGIKLAIDDFGIGYSSLSYLRKLPVGRIKIDKSFIKRIMENEDDLSIVKAIIAMGHSLNMRITAEGVETEDQFRLLRACSCDEVQGYYFSEPIPAEEFERLVEIYK
jgi:diguanylate cyclase (GGDEF)-like protein